jgi:hypothetical protein
MRIIFFSGILLCVTIFLNAQEKQKLLLEEQGSFWQSHNQLTPFRLPFPGKDIEYLDLDKDGDPDVLRATINGNLKVQWIDDDDDMKEGDMEGDTDSDCLMIDRNGDGKYGGEYDLMIDWDDEDGNNLADIQVIADNATWNARRGKYMSHYMIFVDTDKDGIFNYVDWNKYSIEAWDRMGRCNFLPDYNGQSVFLKAHNKVSDIEDLRYNWENPFLFFDKDGDGLTETTIRFCDNGIPLSERKEKAKDKDAKLYRRSFSHFVTGVYMGFDLDNDSRPENELDFDMSLKFTGKGFDYSKYVNKFKSLRGLPEADQFFEDPRWRQITELIYVPHEPAYDEVFKDADWKECWFVYDEDDDCHRWERVEFYEPKDPFKVGSRNGGLDNNPQADVSGDRGEWDLDFSGKGNLYIAPFDGRLHLAGAELGYWRIDQFTCYYQGWQGWRGPSIAPEDLVFTEPEIFATVKYTDTDNNGFFDQIEYDLDGDTLYEETVRLKDMGISDKAELIHTADLKYEDYTRIYSEMADNLWENSLKAVKVAGKYGLNTSWYAYLMHPKTSREKYSYGYWLQFYIHKDLIQMLKQNGDENKARQVLKAYYGSDWNSLLN